MLTARLIEAGTAYYDRRRGQIVRLADNQAAVVCDACEFSVHMPERLGRDQHEVIRRRHLTSAHLTELIQGSVVLTDTEQRILAS